jgi:ribosomal protein L34E
VAVGAGSDQADGVEATAGGDGGEEAGDLGAVGDRGEPGWHGQDHVLTQQCGQGIMAAAGAAPIWLPACIGAELIRGHGRLDSYRRVAVQTPDGGTVALAARHAVVICTGSRPDVPELPGLAEARPWTNRQATDSHAVPGRPLTDDIGLDTVGLEPGSWLEVDDTCMVRALGDGWRAPRYRRLTRSRAPAMPVEERAVMPRVCGLNSRAAGPQLPGAVGGVADASASRACGRVRISSGV